MNNHLSQDQLSMWILGRCTAEELKHGRECPQCRAELARFETPVAAFRSVMLEWSDWEIAPQIEEVLPLLRRPKAILTSWRWVALGTAVLLLTAIPIYRQVSLSPTVDGTAGENADALLMDAVSAHLSRTIPAPMEPIMALIPTQEAQTGGTQ
jgi:anti-sigma factor RsiW